MSNTPTDTDTRIAILAELFIEYKGDKQFDDFFQYNDLGLPLAYAIDSEIVARTPKSDSFINETFELLLEAFGHGEDTGFSSVADIATM